MASIDKSGYLYPNKAGRIYLQALEDVMGRNGVSAILNLAGLETWIDNFPSDNMQRGSILLSYPLSMPRLMICMGLVAVVEWLVEQDGLLLIRYSETLAPSPVSATSLLRFFLSHAKSGLGYQFWLVSFHT